MLEILIAGEFRVWVEEAPAGSAWRVKNLTDSGPGASHAIIVSGVVGVSVRLNWPEGYSYHPPGDDPPIFNYYDEHGNGPYWIDVPGPSDVVKNIALVPGSGYQHVDIEYEWCEGDEEPPPDPPPDPPPPPPPGSCKERLDDLLLGQMGLATQIADLAQQVADMAAMVECKPEISDLLLAIMTELHLIVECECADEG